MDSAIANGFDSRRLELILLPTERCNFRCVYCYENFELGRMSSEVINAIKALLLARKDDLDSLHLSWFGGEPLLAKDIVLEINEFAARAYQGRDFSSSITTNGFLLNSEVFTRLVSTGMRHFQISLDGAREDHDAARPTALGVGTFDTIWRNLLATRDASGSFDITLRVHVSTLSAKRITSLIDMIVQNFGNDPRYQIFLKKVTSLGGRNSEPIPSLSPTAVHRLVAAIRERCLGLIGVGTEDECLDYVCYASKLNSLLIRSDGRVGKCTVALNDDANVIGFLKKDGSMDLDRAKLMHWAEGLFSRQPEQLNCPHSYRTRSA